MGWPRFDKIMAIILVVSGVLLSSLIYQMVIEYQTSPTLRPSTALAQPTATTTAPTAQPTATPMEPTSVPAATSVPSPAATAAPAPTIVAANQLTVPVHIMITRPGLDKPLVDVDIVPGGMIKANGYRIPWTDDHLATWYSGYCGLGDSFTCRMLLTGHRLGWKKAPQIPPPFGQLPEVKVGDTLTLTTADGKTTSFPVKSSFGVSADEAGKYVGRSKGTPVITLMTCAGDYTVQQGTTIASDRWIVEA